MPRDVLAGHHGLDAGDTPGCGGINTSDARVGMGTAQYLAPQHAGEIHVGSEARASGDFVRPRNLGDRGPDHRSWHVHLTIPLGKRLAPQYHAALSTTLRNGSPAANRRALSNKT